MNPYQIPLILLPAGITVVCSFLKQRALKWSLLLLATLTYWAILQLYVQWAYSHPFNPSDGGVRTGAFVFGWAIGLILVVIPTYWISKGIQFIRIKWREKKAKTQRSDK